MSARATAGKVLMGAAVLVPVLLLGAVLAYNQIMGVGVHRTPGAARFLWTWLAVDAAVLLLGLMLNRGDDL